MSGNIIGAQGVVVGHWDSHSRVDESVLRRFADLAVGFQDGTWMEVDPVERDGTVMTVLRAAGYDASGVVLKNLLGQYRDQDGCTGETYVINSICPLTVVHQVPVDPFSGVTRTEDDYSATGWLDVAVTTILRNWSRESVDVVLGKLAEMIEESAPLEPIVLTSFGDCLIETYRTENHVRDTDAIWMKAVRHGRCNGSIEMHPCSEAWRVLACGKCNLRVYVPSSISTFGELRANTHLLVAG